MFAPIVPLLEVNWRGRPELTSLCTYRLVAKEAAQYMPPFTVNVNRTLGMLGKRLRQALSFILISTERVGG